MPTPTEPFQLSMFLPYRLTVIADHLSAGMAKRYKEEFGITVAEWRVLVHVADAQAVSIRDIHRTVHVGKSKASRAASTLEAAGYLKKDVNTDDKRLVILSLTEKGQDLINKLHSIASEYQVRLEKIVSANQSAFNQALDQLAKADL